eukprot:scaffold61839_cov69-Phaeocystis_antarctica.AAC.9
MGTARADPPDDSGQEGPRFWTADSQPGDEHADSKVYRGKAVRVRTKEAGAAPWPAALRGVRVVADRVREDAAGTRGSRHTFLARVSTHKLGMGPRRYAITEAVKCTRDGEGR